MDHAATAPTSFWTAERRDAPLSAPRGAKCDVCIVGGGFTGLWTALRLKEADAALDVMLVEANRCGDGASGRNGGGVLTWLHELPQLIDAVDLSDARTLLDASFAAVKSIGKLNAECAPGFDFRMGGWLYSTTVAARSGTWEVLMDAATRVGQNDGRLVLRDEAIHLTGLPTLLDGYLERTAATVHPDKLVRALVERCRALGVRLHEGTRLLGWSRGGPMRVRTSAGEITADKLALCLNAYAHRLGAFRRTIMPVRVDAMAGDAGGLPIGGDLRDAGMGLTTRRCRPDFMQASAAGPFVFGKAGLGVPSRGRMPPFDARMPPGDLAALQADAQEVLTRPLGAVSHAWPGYIGRTASGLPECGILDGGRVVYAHGYGGNGVGPSVVVGGLLASVIEGSVRDHPLMRRRRNYLPVEPARSMGARLALAASTRRDRLESEGAEVPMAVRVLSDLPNHLGRTKHRPTE